MTVTRCSRSVPRTGSNDVALRAAEPPRSVTIHDVRSGPTRETDDVKRDTLATTARRERAATLTRARQFQTRNEHTMSYYGTDLDTAEASFDDPTDELEANA